MAPKETKEPEGPTAPSLVGFTPEQLQALLSTLGSTSASAMREAYRQQRKENPNYPEKSVFNPLGKFDDDGNPRAAKVTLSRVTRFVKVRLSDETMTPEEIELCNRFTSTKEARGGKWRAEVVRKDNIEELLILNDFSVVNVDERADLPPLTFILRELLDGADAVNPEVMATRMAALEAKIKALEAAGLVPA